MAKLKRVKVKELPPPPPPHVWHLLLTDQEGSLLKRAVNFTINKGNPYFTPTELDELTVVQKSMRSGGITT